MDKCGHRIGSQIQRFLTFLQTNGLAFERQPNDFVSQQGCDSYLKVGYGYDIIVVCKTRASDESLPWLIAEQKRLKQQNSHLILLADSMGNATMDELRRNGIGFYVENGPVNIRIPNFTYVVQKELSGKVTPRNPTRNTVFVGKGSRLCRILLSHPEKNWHQIDLSRISGLTKGYVSILMKKFLEEGYVIFSKSGYHLANPDVLLNEWTQTYRFNRFEGRKSYAVAMKDYRDGLKKVAGQLKGAGIPFAFTGWSSASIRAPYMEPPLMMAYVGQLPDKLPGIHPVDSGGNLSLYKPMDEGRFQEGMEIDGLPLVSDVQTYLDLKNLPGRADDQAEFLRDQLLKWEK